MRRSTVAAALVAACLLMLAAVPAMAFPLELCQLSLTSTNAAGDTVDTAQSGANDATQTDPFLVDWDGAVRYSGTTTNVIKNYSYQVYVLGIPTPIRGADEGTERTEGNGSISVSANMPVRVTGLFKVSGTYSGEGGTCSGSGWFKLTGDPVGTVPFLLGIILVLVGAVLEARGLLGHRVSAVVGGLLIGLGAAMLLVIYSTLPLAEYTPLAVLGLGLLFGILIAMLRGGRDRVAPAEA